MRLADPLTGSGAAASILDDGLRSPADLECGLAALLLTCAPEWLEQHPDRAAWCRERLLAPFVALPPRSEFDHASDVSTERWDFFAAEAIPILWKDAPEDADLRAAVVRLATHIHHNTVLRLFAGIDAGPELLDGLQQLEAVALQVARYRAWQREREHRRRYAEHGFGEALSPDDLPDVATPTQEIVEAFEMGTLTPEMPRLRDFLAETPDGLVPNRRRSPRSDALRLVDPEYLLAALGHLLRLPPDAQPIERQRRLLFGADLAEFLATAMAPDERKHDVEGTHTRSSARLL